MIQKLNLVVLCLCISACIQIRDPKKQTASNQNAPVPAPKVSLQVQKLSYEIQALPQPQRYLVRFLGIGPDEKVTLQRQKLNSDEKPSLVSGLEDIVDQPGQYQYRLHRGPQEEEIQVAVPQDILLSGAVSLSQLPVVDVKDDPDYDKRISLKGGRLFLKAGALLTTNGAKLLLEADHIESEGATLQTFTTDFTVSNGNAPSGGTIHLRSRSMRGSLHVVMRGVRGPNGLVFPVPGKIMQRDGFNGGNSGLLIVEVQDMSRASITYELIAGKGGTGVSVKNQSKAKDGRDGIKQPPCLLRNNKCEELKAYNN